MVKQEHGLSLKGVKAIFDQAYLIDQKNHDPLPFRAIGWCGGRLCSVTFEIRRDEEGEYYRLITPLKATIEEERSYAENISESPLRRRNCGNGHSRREYFRLLYQPI